MLPRAAESLQFERAASLRDKLRRLEGCSEQFARLRFAVEELSFLYTVSRGTPATTGRTWCGAAACARAAGAQRAREHARLRELAREVFAPPERRSAAVPTHEVEELLLLSSWFRRFPASCRTRARPSSTCRCRTRSTTSRSSRRTSPPDVSGCERRGPARCRPLVASGVARAHQPRTTPSRTPSRR
jgi:hypothetical protein